MQTVWKCVVFFAFAFKVCKKCYYDPKIFFLNINMGIKKRRILRWFQIRWCRLKQMSLKKLKPKNYANFEYFRFCAFFRVFLLLTFVRGISDTHIDIFKKKFFWVIIAFCAYFKCKCEKNYTFSNILQKVKSYFFGNIYQSPFDSYWNSKKSIKLKPPSVGAGFEPGDAVQQPSALALIYAAPY